MRLVRYLHNGCCQQRRNQTHREDRGKLPQDAANQADRAEISPSDCCFSFHRYPHSTITYKAVVPVSPILFMQEYVT